MSSRADVWTAITTRYVNWRQGIGQAPGGVAALIAEYSTSVVIVRQDPVTHAKTTLAAQTVRIDLDTSLRAPLEYGRAPSTSVTNKQRIVILGYLDDPTGIADTDMALMDSFYWHGQQFTVRKLEFMQGDRLIAEAEAEG